MDIQTVQGDDLNCPVDIYTSVIDRNQQTRIQQNNNQNLLKKQVEKQELLGKKLAEEFENFKMHVSTFILLSVLCNDF